MNYKKSNEQYYTPQYLDSICNLLQPPNNHKIRTPYPKQQNPNEMAFDAWINLGLSPKLANAIIHYRNKGGTFKVKSDLLKMYGFDSVKYLQIEPYLYIPEPNIGKQANIFSSASKADIKLEMNTADSLSIERLPGIGAILTSRILKYRALLGGFSTVMQLTEIYGLKAETYEKIKNMVFVDTLKIEKINLKTTDIKKLMKHPYIGYKCAIRIAKLRTYQTGFDVKTLYQKSILDSAQVAKLHAYITN